MATKDFFSHDELIDETFGKKGTSKRDEYELSLDLFLVGDAIKQIRKSKNLTQKDLGKLIGVQKAQISKIENGRNITIDTVMKVFRALEVDVKLQINNKGLEIAVV